MIAFRYSGVERVHFEGMHFRRDVGRRVVRLGVMGSTRGTDMQHLIYAIKAGTLAAEIKLVVSNKEDAYVPSAVYTHIHNLIHYHILSLYHRCHSKTLTLCA